MSFGAHNNSSTVSVLCSIMKNLKGPIPSLKKLRHKKEPKSDNP